MLCGWAIGAGARRRAGRLGHRWRGGFVRRTVAHRDATSSSGPRGRQRCSGLLPSALYSILCWATAGSTWASPSSRQPDHGRVLTRCVREDDDAVRREHASRKRYGALRRRAAVAERPLVALNRGYHGPLSRVRSPPRSRWPERRRGVRCRRFVSSRWWRPRGRGLPSASGAVRSVIAAAPPSTTSGLGAGRQPPSAPAHG